MNSTGLNIIKTLGCMTAVTFFTIYNTWDHYDYDYHWILGFLTFISALLQIVGGDKLIIPFC